MADSADTIITATLVRGKNYSFFNTEKGAFETYKRNVPVEVDEEVADRLEELVETVSTTDGDEIEKPLFEIDREAERRTEEDKAPKRMRLRMVPADEGKKAQAVSTRTAPPPGRGTGLKVAARRS